MQGTIAKLFARGFGFITSPDGTTYFFHASDTSDFDSLAIGDLVAFAVEQAPKGPKARRVTVIAAEAGEDATDGARAMPWAA